MGSQRAALLVHLREQVRHLTDLVDRAKDQPEDGSRLVAVRDETFTIAETLDSLGVRNALASHEEWSEAIGTERMSKPLLLTLDDRQADALLALLGTLGPRDGAAVRLTAKQLGALEALRRDLALRRGGDARP
jgi:hypothetical protein